MNDMVYLSFSLLQKCSCHSPTSEDSFDKAWKVSAYTTLPLLSKNIYVAMYHWIAGIQLCYVENKV